MVDSAVPVPPTPPPRDFLSTFAATSDARWLPLSLTPQPQPATVSPKLSCRFLLSCVINPLELMLFVQPIALRLDHQDRPQAARVLRKGRNRVRSHLRPTRATGLTRNGPVWTSTKPLTRSYAIVGTSGSSIRLTASAAGPPCSHTAQGPPGLRHLYRSQD